MTFSWRRVTAALLLVCAPVWALPSIPRANAGASQPPGANTSLSNVTAGAFATLVARANNLASPSGDHPGAVSAWWCPPLNSGSSSGNGAAVAAIDTAYCVPVDAVRSGYIIKSLGVWVTAAGTAANVKLALYTNDPISYRPESRVAVTAGVSISGTGQTSAATTATYAATANFYWACSLWTWSGAASAAQLVSGTADSGGKLGAASFQNAFWSGVSIGTKYNTSGLYAAGFPASLSNLTTDSNDTYPIVAWQEN